VETPLRWLARGEAELPAELDWLTPREAAKAAGLRTTKRRTEYLLRRWVGKQAVAAALPALALDGSAGKVSLSRIEMANRASGAPYVLVDGAPVGLEVSLTDRAGWAVCAVGPDTTRVGCDLELVEPRTPGFVRDFLTVAEQQYVERADAAGRHDEAANLLWSAKESALKVLRTGLRRDPRSVEVEVTDPLPEATADGWGALQVAPSGAAVLPGWWRRDGRFLLTVVTDRHPDTHTDTDVDVPRPERLPGSAELSHAVPVHSWLERPLAPG
jgi:4'-phosphopantetheinyl transferase